MKLLLLLLALTLFCVHYTNSENVKDERWRSFKAKHGKIFLPKSSYKETICKQAFQNAVQYARNHNKRFIKGLETYKTGTNKYSDVHPKNLRLRAHDLVIPIKTPKPTLNIKSRSSLRVSRKTVKIPQKLDWRENGVITPVKDQKNCGSGWAFAAVAAVEAHAQIAQKTKIKASEQQLVDCSGNLGCLGGSVSVAFDYIKKNGITTANKYVYNAKTGSCLYKPSQSVLTIKGFAKVKAGDEQLLAETVAFKGPVVVAIDANGKGFYHYKEGVYYNPKCTDKPTHLLLVVGYGTENGQDYWLAKNSWGTTWGDKGYIKMARNRKNHCGIASQALYPLL